MTNLIAFLNVFCSYLLLFGIIAVLAVVAVFIGIRLRKNKDAKNSSSQEALADNQ
ncbi:MAG: vanadium nitrogenase [Lachnospiraceae bacterium]